MGKQTVDSLKRQTLETLRKKGWVGAIDSLVASYRMGTLPIDKFLGVGATLIDSAIDLAKQKKYPNAISLARVSEGVLRAVVLDVCQPYEFHQQAVRYQQMCLSMICVLEEKKGPDAVEEFLENAAKAKKAADDPYAPRPGEQPGYTRMRNMSSGQDPKDEVPEYLKDPYGSSGTEKTDPDTGKVVIFPKGVRAKVQGDMVRVGTVCHLGSQNPSPAMARAATLYIKSNEPVKGVGALIGHG